MEASTDATDLEEVDVICGSLKAKLRVNNLCDGRSRCVLLGGSVLTPCEYERSAGIGSKNWKRSVRYRGKPLIHFLEYYTNSRGKKCVKFINGDKDRHEPLSSSQPLLITFHSASVVSLNSTLQTNAITPSTTSSSADASTPISAPCSSTLGTVSGSTVTANRAVPTAASVPLPYTSISQSLSAPLSGPTIPSSITSPLCTSAEVPKILSVPLVGSNTLSATIAALVNPSASDSQSISTNPSEPTSSLVAGSSESAAVVACSTSNSVASLSDQHLAASVSECSPDINPSSLPVVSPSSVSSSLTITSTAVTGCLVATAPLASSSILPTSTPSDSNVSPVPVTTTAVIDASKSSEREAQHCSAGNELQQAVPLVATDSSDCTIVVRGFQQPISQEMIELYFTNEPKSGGGEIADIVIREKDIFVAFTDQAVAARVAEKKFHKIVGGTVEVELVAPTGSIESVTSDDPNSHDNYDNILILDNVPQTVQDEVLLLYIDSITKLDSEDGDYTIARNNTEVVVTFKPDNMPPADLDGVITQISNTLLEQFHIQARCPVMLANSVIVENIPMERCSRDWLDMYFTNKSKSGIESYKEIDILSNQKVVIHLENQNDMETVLKQSHSSLGDDVVVAQCKFLPLISQSAVTTAPASTAKQETFVIKVLKPRVIFLKNNYEKLEKMLSYICAAVSVDTEMEQVEINPCPGCESLEDWKCRCQSIVNAYLENIITETVAFPGDLKTAMLSSVARYKHSHPLVELVLDEKLLAVTISGEKLVVDEIKTKLEKERESKMTEREPLTIRNKFVTFFKSKINALRQQTQPEPNVTSSVSFAEEKVMLQSNKENSASGMSLVKVKISNDKAQFLSSTRGRDLLQSYFQGVESLVTVRFDAKGTLYLLSDVKSDGVTVARKIENQVVSLGVVCPEVFFPFIKTKEWALFQLNLEKTHNVCISITNDKVIVIGDTKSLNSVKQSIQQLIKNECCAEISQLLCEAQWRLLTTHMIRRWNRIEQKLESETRVQYIAPSEGDRDACIILKGVKLVATDFAKEIEQLICSICTSPLIEQTRPGTVKFFNSEKGTTLIRGIEAEEKSCIQLNMSQDSGDIKSDMVEKGATRGRNRLCMGRTKEGKVVALVQGDIAELPADVIVNAANFDLKHVGGVALAIARKGGPIIQQESDHLVSMVGVLCEGDAVVAKEVGKLPCKGLVHAVVPKWNDGCCGEEGLLKQAWLESLKLASNFNSVSLPFISPKEFGYPMEKSAGCTVQAILQHSACNALSTLNEITIIVHDHSAVSAIAHEMSQNLDNLHSTIGNASVSLPLQASCEIKDSIPNNNSSIADYDIVMQFLELHKGELLKQKADIYVSPARDSLDLRYGAVAASLLKAGGQALQDECTAYVTRYGRVPVGKIAVTRPGLLTSCKWIFHVVGSKYDGKSSEQVMQRLVLKCLEKCDRLKAHCIAFPALGTGGFNFPHDVAADVIVRTIISYLKSNLATTNIKTVKLVVYTEDTYAAFHNLLSRIPDDSSEKQPTNIPKEIFPAKSLQKYSAPFKSSHSQETNSLPTDSLIVGSVNVVIREGDITDADSDAIVNTTNRKMKLKGSGVAGAILQKGGPDMQKICDDLISQGFRLREGKVCATQSTGSLKCKYIIHTVVPESKKQLLGKTITSCLAYAEKLTVSSIAFPAIGTGKLGYSLDEAAYSICNSIILFSQTNPTHVKQVSVIALDKSVCQFFKDTLISKTDVFKHLNTASSGNEGLVSFDKGVFQNVSQPKSSTSFIPDAKCSVLSIQIYAEDQNKVARTLDRLQRIIDEQFTNENLIDDFVSKLSCKQKDEITRKAKLRHIEVSIGTSGDQNCIQLRGDRNDVAELKFEIQQVINHTRSVESTQREAKLLHDKVKWQWLNRESEYEDFDMLTNYHIEQAYQNNRGIIYVHKDDDDVCKEFDFNKMEVFRDQTLHKIKRIDIEDLLKDGECPTHWATISQGVTCYKVALTVTDQEYLDVKAKFESSMYSSNSVQSSLTNRVHPSILYTGFTKKYNHIVKIERIENSTLYAQYMARKRMMDQQNSPGIENEMELFHGCPRDVTDKISYQGFNRSFAGKNATKYGRGVYFAWDASYSANDVFSPKDGKGYKYMFLAKVLTGDFTVGNPSYIQPPPKNPNGLDLFDSVVDSISRPSIFVIFADAQAYPDYLITFT